MGDLKVIEANLTEICNSINFGSDQLNYNQNVNFSVLRLNYTVTKSKNHNLIQIHYIIIELCKFDYNIVDYNRS